jgi:hypothetical protein
MKFSIKDEDGYVKFQYILLMVILAILIPLIGILFAPGPSCSGLAAPNEQGYCSSTLREMTLKNNVLVCECIK